MDLNQPMYEDESSDTPVSSWHPIGNKAAKQEQGEGDDLTESGPDPDSDPDFGCGTCIQGFGKGYHVEDVVGHAQRP